MDNVNEIFAKNITKLRVQHHLTQLELAEKLNYSDKAISRWERGEAIPDVRVLMQIGDMFDVSLDSLLKNEIKEDSNKGRVRFKRENATWISFVGVWTAALLTFVVLLLCHNAQWLVFVYALPVSLIVLLVFNSIWGNTLARFIIISLLVWSILAAIYLTALTIFHVNWWPLFLIGLPSQLIVFLSFRFLKK